MLVLAEDGRIARCWPCCLWSWWLPLVRALQPGCLCPATDPDQRKRALAVSFSHYADFYLAERLADCLTVVPAEPSLHRYFSTAFSPASRQESWSCCPR